MANPPRPGSNSRRERENHLEARVRRSRKLLIGRSEKLMTTVRSTCDIMAPVRRDPLGGIAAAVSTGFLLGGLGPFLSRRRGANGQAAPSPPSISPFSLLWSFLLAAGPSLVKLTRRHAAEESSEPPKTNP